MNADEYYVSGTPRDEQGDQNTKSSDVKVENGTFCWKVKDEPAPDVVPPSPKRNCIPCCCCQSSVLEESSPEDDTNDAPTAIPFILKNISIRINHGYFVGVTGKVGSGKSSLFASLMAEMEKHEGNIWLRQRRQGVAFVTQEPWIQHLSVRDNILFGRPYEPTRYNDVVHACALEEDIKLLPAGDLTEVGDNGVNLSGGQKARISLARAVYQDKEVFFLYFYFYFFFSFFNLFFCLSYFFV